MSKKNSDYEIDTMLKNYCARRTQIAFDVPVEEKRMLKGKGIKIAATAFALTAVLSAGIFSSFMFNDSGTAKKQSGFSITAYAAEATSDEASQETITNENFLKIGNIKPEMIIQGSIMQDVSGTSPNVVGVIQDFNIRCEGENIDKVTYEVKNGDFFIDADDKTVFDLKPSKTGTFIPVKKGDELKWHLAGDYSSVVVSEKNVYSEFSVKYEDQEELHKKGGSNFSKIGLFTQFYNDTEKEMSDKEMYESVINQVVISVTSTYKDGTTETQKIRLNGEYDEDFGITVTAKLID